MLNGSLPAFELEVGEFWVALLRGLFVVALFSSYGALLYRVRLAGAVLTLVRGPSAAALEKRYGQIALGSLAAALVAACLWLIGEAGILFTAKTGAEWLYAIGSTLASTSFGHVLSLQMALVAAALGLVLAARKDQICRDLAMGGIGLAVVLQVGHDHAASMYDGISVLMLSEIAHLLAGAAWLGSLLPLLVTIRQAPAPAAQAAAARFSPFGVACVRVLVVTALIQGWQLIGSVPGLIGTAYGLMAVAKIVLFSTLLLLAASNRYRLTPRLIQGETAKADIVRSITVETGFGFALLIAAGLLVTLPPSIHEQPVWPFTTRFSLVTVLEEPSLFSEVILATFAIAIALFVLAMGFYFRRMRWPAAAAAAVIAWFAIPHLALLFVEAYPTSFYHSPTGFAATSIARGATLYPDHCASCHGAQGRGDGPMAAGLPDPPANLTAGHLWAHDDGELFWWLSDGIRSPEGAQVMPAFGGVLSEEERWNLIDYIRANNVGLNYAETGLWSPSTQAPGFQAECTDGAVTSQALRGRVVRLVFGKTMPLAPDPALVADKLVTVLASPGSVPLGPMQCLAHDPSLVKAYAAVSGLRPDELAGSEFLIDTNGWLRALQKPGQAINWNDPGKLGQMVVQLCAHPLLAANDTGHAHHHH